MKEEVRKEKEVLMSTSAELKSIIKSLGSSINKDNIVNNYNNDKTIDNIANDIINFIDMADINNKANDFAKNIVEKNATFYLVNDDIIQDPYVQQKILSDIAIIKDLSIQSMIADYSISKMINQIDASFGNVHPRLFEVLSNFQRSKLDITKTIAQYIIMIQDNFKNIKMDYLKQKEEKDIEMNLIDGTNDSIVAKGTKNLIENLSNILTELKTKELDRE
jgi:hypothetical protein